ncbi:MAG: SDR family NAD(P)-dependent oxidoreductase, partial [Parvularculaceae bacterium]|nr:SDR family NAD(P)-dependent oxidoreductase [Parvularculaceae bacterium]
EALKGVAGAVEIAVMDLADLASVVAFAKSVRDATPALHLLINNAGIMACPLERIGKGWESQFATNHIGHFVLARELAPLLRKAGNARVVALSSLAHRRSDILWDDPHFLKTPYEKWTAYGQSKTANALFAVGLDAREKAHGVRAFAVHPGGILTPLQRHLQNEEMVAIGWVDETGELTPRAKEMFKSPSGGAATTLWCATSPRLAGEGGVYCEDCDFATLSAGKGSPTGEVKPYAVDPEAAARLWAMTEAMLG